MHIQKASVSNTIVLIKGYYFFMFVNGTVMNYIWDIETFESES